MEVRGLVSMKDKQLPPSTNWMNLIWTRIWPPWTCTSSRMAEWEVECERHRLLKMLEGWNPTSICSSSPFSGVRNQAIYQTSADSFQSIRQPAKEAPEQPHPQRQDKTSMQNCNCLETARPNDQTLSCSYQKFQCWGLHYRGNDGIDVLNNRFFCGLNASSSFWDADPY